MKNILLTGLFLALAATGFNANAMEQRWPQWYVGVSGAVTMLRDSDISGPGISGDASFDTGYGITGAIGYRPNSDITFFNNMRFELEAGYHLNNGDTYNPSGGGAFGFPYEAKAISYMVNALYDVNTGTRLIPYVGAGVGYSNVEFIDDNDMVFSYQFLAGVGYEPELIPNTVWSLGYRYFGTQDASLSDFGTPYSFEYNSHSLEAGLQMRF